MKTAGPNKNRRRLRYTLLLGQLRRRFRNVQARRLYVARQGSTRSDCTFSAICSFYEYSCQIASVSSAEASMFVYALCQLLQVRPNSLAPFRCNRNRILSSNRTQRVCCLEALWLRHPILPAHSDVKESFLPLTLRELQSIQSPRLPRRVTACKFPPPPMYRTSHVDQAPPHRCWHRRPGSPHTILIRDI